MLQLFRYICTKYFFLQFLGEFLTAFLFKDISKIGGQVNNLLSKYTVALMHVYSCASDERT